MSNIFIKITLGLAFLTLCSCSGTSESKIICEEFNAEPTIKMCNSKKELSDGAYLGEVIAYQGKNKIEMNMLSQMKSYNSALVRGDYDNACHYLYPDAVKYFKRFYVGESDDNIMRHFFSCVTKDMVQTINNYENHGINIDIVVSRIIRKVTQGDNIIYVFEVVSNLTSPKLQIHTNPNQTIAISTNSGKNWTFNDINEDTPNILRISYSNDVVDAVMGY